MTTVLLADDHEVYRRGLRSLLSPAFEIVAEAGHGGEAVEKALSLKPNVVILDVRMPGMSGIEAAREIKANLPGTEIVMISATGEDQQIADAVAAGVTSFVCKDDAAESMLEAVRSAAEGRVWLPPRVATRLVTRLADARGKPSRTGSNIESMPLSPREVSVLRLLAQGKRNREIAQDLCISERTVGNHIANIYAKLFMYDRSQLIVYAIKHGILNL